MIQGSPTLSVLALTVLVMFSATSAFPLKYKLFRPYPRPPVRIPVHAPVTGAQIALARAQALQPFLNPGIVPTNDYVYVDDVIAAPDPVYPVNQAVKNHVVILNKPELDNVNIGGNPGFDYYREY